MGHRHPATRLARVDPRLPQCLADIDVAEPGDDPLVEQQQLDRLLASPRGLAQMLCRQRIAQRLGTERGERRPRIEFGCQQQVDRTEAPRVVQREDVFPGREYQMVMLVGILGIDPPASAHTQVKHQRVVAVGMDQSVFCAARQARNRRAGHCLHQIGREWAAHVGSVDPYADDPLALEEPGEAANGGFDFGKLGHDDGAGNRESRWRLFAPFCRCARAVAGPFATSRGTLYLRGMGGAYDGLAREMRMRLTHATRTHGLR